MPTSFNVAAAFVEPDERTLILKLLPEQHFNISFTRMLDHITDPKNVSSMKYCAEKMEELTIYEINALGGYSRFTIPGHEEYVFCGIGFVREGDELAIITVIGKSGREPSEVTVPADTSILAPGKSFILDGVDSIDLTQQPLFDDINFSPVILLTRLDVKTDTIQARYALEETIDTFSIVTDDPQTIESSRSMPGWTAEGQSKNLDRFREYEPLFEISNSLVSCIDLCDSDDLVVERHPTALRLDSNSQEPRYARAKLSGIDVPNYINVATLYEVNLGQTAFELPASSLKMESTGYWKTLPLGTSGRDRNGQPVQGKTWVTTKESWFEEHIGRYAVDSSPVRVDITDDETVGVVYVLRSAIHKKNVLQNRLYDKGC